MDSDVIWNSDHAYETISSNRVYNTKFVYFSDECIDCSFMFNCLGCILIVSVCVNLRNQNIVSLIKNILKKNMRQKY